MKGLLAASRLHYHKQSVKTWKEAEAGDGNSRIAAAGRCTRGAKAGPGLPLSRSATGRPPGTRRRLAAAPLPFSALSSAQNSCEQEKMSLPSSNNVETKLPAGEPFFSAPPDTAKRRSVLAVHAGLNSCRFNWFRKPQGRFKAGRGANTEAPHP